MVRWCSSQLHIKGMFKIKSVTAAITIEGFLASLTINKRDIKWKFDACNICEMVKQDSTPRIVKFGEYEGCPCGGTHVSDISMVGSLKVIQHSL